MHNSFVFLWPPLVGFKTVLPRNADAFGSSFCLLLYVNFIYRCGAIFFSGITKFSCKSWLVGVEFFFTSSFRRLASTFPSTPKLLVLHQAFLEEERENCTFAALFGCPFQWPPQLKAITRSQARRTLLGEMAAAEENPIFFKAEPTQLIFTKRNSFSCVRK